MSRFLKFIVHFIVICTVLCVVALVAPPFWGITTVIVDNTEKETNLPLGSVTYAIPVDTEDVSIGTSILVQNGGQTYRYNIASLDLENGTGTVVDPTNSEGEALPVSVKNKVPQVVVTVGLIGYLFVATESIEGLIILGLAVLFLVILYIIAELWKKEPAGEAADEDGTYIKSKKELKREEKERARRMKEEDKQLLREDKARRKQEKKDRKVIRTGGFVDEVYEDDFSDEEADETPVTEVQNATSEAHELLKKEIAATTADEISSEQGEELAEAAAQISQPEEEPELSEEPAEIKKMAIPLWSAAQLADKAKQEGDAPDIVKDGITNVTLFDYSDIISGEEATEVEQ